MDFLRILDFDSFWSIWFWSMLSISWSITCHWTLGVPFDMVVRANRRGGRWAEDCDQLVRINTRRIVDMFSEAGTLIAGVSAFVLAVLATFGFWLGYEFPRAIFVLLAPLTIVGAMTVQLALRIDAQAPDAEAVRRALARRRFWNQVIGLLTIALAAGLAVLEEVPGTILYDIGG